MNERYAFDDLIPPLIKTIIVGALGGMAILSGFVLPLGDMLEPMAIYLWLISITFGALMACPVIVAGIVFLGVAPAMIFGRRMASYACLPLNLIVGLICGKLVWYEINREVLKDVYDLWTLHRPDGGATFGVLTAGAWWFFLRRSPASRAA